MHVLAEVDTFW